METSTNPGETLAFALHNAIVKLATLTNNGPEYQNLLAAASKIGEHPSYDALTYLFDAIEVAAITIAENHDESDTTTASPAE